MDKLICVGKNYFDHAAELGDAIPEKPVLFLKPPSVQVIAESMGAKISVFLPRGQGEVHPECEILTRINAKGIIQAVSLGLDMTLRDVQGNLKKQGHPWELGKVFRDSAVVGPWILLSEFSDYLEQPFSFKVEGKLRQQSRGKSMRLLPDECIQYASEFFPLVDGDIFYTGTPAGVGSVSSGQIGQLYWRDQLLYQVEFK